MDEFAQSREDDDLFADEFEPLPESTTVDTPKHPTPNQNNNTAQVPTTSSNQVPPNVPGGGGGGARNSRREHGSQDVRRQQRGGRGGQGQNGLNQSRYAPQSESQAPIAHNPAPVAVESTSEAPLISDRSSATPSQPATTVEPTPTLPIVPTQPAQSLQGLQGRTPAVRGDRSATGGPLHKKLTEEELTIKLEKMAIINAQKAERHRLQEADQAAFQHRETELAKERKEKSRVEQKNSRQMEMERAKNRQRKINAQGGREWDSEKVEEDIVDRKGRSSEYVRGGHGGVIRGGRGGGLSGSRHATEGDEIVEDAGNSRGRGGFEIRGRGRGGRGGRGGKSGGQQGIPTLEDFPSLPMPVASAKGEETIKSPMEPTGAWADEMSTPVEEKKIDI